MVPLPKGSEAQAPAWTEHPFVRAGTVILLLYLFLVGVNGLGLGFRALGEGVLDSFFRATENQGREPEFLIDPIQ